MEKESIGDKDVFPTPEMNSTDGKVRVWPGPGLTFFEYTVVEMAKGIISSPVGPAFEADLISSEAIKQACSLIAGIEHHYEELKQLEAEAAQAESDVRTATGG